MAKVIDIPDTSISIGTASNSIIEKARKAMEARKMGNAVEIHTPAEMTEQRAVMTPMEMVGRALEMGVSADILKQMMDLRDREDAKQARKAFDTAISRAKSKMSPVVKNATGHNNKRYADFSAIARMVDPVLSEFGLSYRFKTTQLDKITVTCVLSHEDGHSEETTLSAPSDTTGNKNAIQAIGSTITYLSRYSLMASLGLSASEDDDGRAAGMDSQSVSEDQTKQIRELIEKADLDIEAFCNRWQVNAVTDIAAKQFNEVVQSLRQRIAYNANQRAQGSAA